MTVRALVLALMLATAAVTALADEPQDAGDGLEAWRGVTVTDITLAGNHVTKDWVIGREIWTEIGDPLDLQVVREDITRLENLAIFGSVVVTPTPLKDGVALNYEFTEMPWIIPYPSLAYTEENGFSVGLGVASPNFRGRNITLSALARAGGTNIFSFKAENPWITGNHVSAGVEAWHQIRQNKLLDFKQTSDMVGLMGGSYLGQYGRLKFEGGYYGVGSDKPDITLNPRNYDNLWNGAVSLGYDSRDSWRVPHEGWHNEFKILYLGGDANTWTLDFDAVRYQPLGDRHTLATGPLLSVQSGEVDQEIPSYMQYFLGGANSIRGYRLEELGAEIYGKNQLLYNLEYRYLLVPVQALRLFKWSFGLGLEAAAFADAGVAWSRGGDFNLDRTHLGFGAGMRLLVPSIEMVRFDFGISQEGTMLFNFGINSMFFQRKQRVR